MTKKLRPREVVEAYEKYKLHEGGTGENQATSNWPTVLAHDCRAYAFYNRVVPGDQRKQFSADLKMIFSEGHDHARMVRRDLEEIGFELADQERSLQWPQYQISGRQDFKIVDGDQKIDVEMKSCSRFTFAAINEPDDLLNPSKMWLRKWYKQIALYMILKGVERYWLLMKSKESGQIKIIEFEINDEIYNMANEMVSKAEWVNKLVQIGGTPKAEDKISDEHYCSECEFFDTCLPDLSFGPGAIILDAEAIGELEAQLDRREELQPLKKEYEDLDAELKEVIKSMTSEGQEKVVIGKWVASRKEGQRKGYEVKPCTTITIKFFRT